MDLAVDDPGDDDLDRPLGGEAGVERLSPGERLEAVGREGRLAGGWWEAAAERGGDGLAPVLEGGHGLPNPAERARERERAADLAEGVGAAHPEALREAEGRAEDVEHVGRRVLREDGGAEVGACAEAVEGRRDEAGAEQVGQAVGGVSEPAGLVGAAVVVGLAARGVGAVRIESGQGVGLVGDPVVLLAGERLEAVGAGVGVGRAGGDGAALGGGAAEGVGGEHGDWGFPATAVGVPSPE